MGRLVGLIVVMATYLHALGAVMAAAQLTFDTDLGLSEHDTILMRAVGVFFWLVALVAVIGRNRARLGRIVGVRLVQVTASLMAVVGLAFLVRAQLGVATMGALPWLSELLLRVAEPSHGTWMAAAIYTAITVVALLTAHLLPRLPTPTGWGPGDGTPARSRLRRRTRRGSDGDP